MKLALYIGLLLFGFSKAIFCQTKADLENQRKKTLEEIEYVDKLIESTEKERSTGVKELKILGNKLQLRESVISGMNQEIKLLEERIELNDLAILLMEEDLMKLRSDYTRTIINSYKSKKLNPQYIYIISARDFNQGYKRLKYLQQVSKIRRNESELIQDLKVQVEDSKARKIEDLTKISELKGKEMVQKELLQREQDRKQRLVKSLSQKEKQLQKELEEKRKVAKRIEKEINRIIEEEKRKNTISNLTPEQRLIGEDFSGNKGRLPWPVERGIITDRFGTHQHPVLKYVTEKNDGIDITANEKIKARSVFKGEVTAITAISGSNMTVIVRHGKFLTVYNNLINVKVKKGEKVETKQELGDVYPDPTDNFSCTIKFMIFEEKFLDPELWIAKN